MDFLYTFQVFFPTQSVETDEIGMNNKAYDKDLCASNRKQLFLSLKSERRPVVK